MKLLPSACLALILIACTSSDGEVFRSPAGSPGLPCVQAPFVVQQTAAAAFAVTAASDGALVVAQVGEDARLFRVRQPSNKPTVSAFVVGRSGYTYSVAPSEGAGPLWMVFQNHSLAGQWRVYAAAWNETTGLNEMLTTLSNDGAENIGPKAAWLGSRLGVAFRQDAQLTFVVTDGTSIVGRDLGADLSPPPVITRVLTRPQGFIVAYKRTNAALAYFDTEGKPSGGVELPSPTSDVTLVGAALVAISANASSLDRVTLDSNGVAAVTPLNVEANANVLRVATQSNHVAVAYLESAGTAAARLRFLWNQGESSLAYPALVVPNAVDVDVVPTTQGALVFYRTDAAVMARFYCSATMP